MKRYSSFEDYIAGNSNYEKELVALRDLLLDSGLEEKMKWGSPTYCLNNKNVVGIGAFKSYVGLWFHQGALLKDEKKLLINAQEGVTKALRQIRFQSIEEMDFAVLKTYILEAVENQKKGLEIKAESKTEFQIPEKLAKALENDGELNTAFSTFTPYKQREYAEYIGGAKREQTRLNRLDKCIPMIKQNQGLNDKYRK